MNDRQAELLGEKKEASEPVECLGLVFSCDEERREHFRGKLREKLQDPDFRKIDGFPLGSDEDILALSDPPYYTACPNPFVRELLSARSLQTPAEDTHERKPYALDISMGKNEPKYNVHAYATKVPPGAITPLIEHYCEQGDVILDPFSGTGMTGVALEDSGLEGIAILQDLSPGATHIAWALQQRIDAGEFRQAASAILRDVTKECGWMYATKLGAKEKAVRYFVWSDVYVCDTCGAEVTIWDIEGKASVGGLKEKALCPGCGSMISKQSMSPLTETVFDQILGSPVRRIKSRPVLKVVVESNRATKVPVDARDLKILSEIERQAIPYSARTERMLLRDGSWGDQWRSSYHLGVTHSHQFYTYRNYWILTCMWDRVEQTSHSRLRQLLRFWFTASLSRLTRLNRYMKQHDRHVGPLAGTLFIGPIQAEISPFYFCEDKIEAIASALAAHGEANQRLRLVSTGSSTDLLLPDNSVDFIFTDPPFGDNLMYSELNFLVEAWLRVYTNDSPEAVISKTQAKDLSSFEQLIKSVFAECYRVLKSGRWIVVEFHNSRNAVWSAIQEAIGVAGFVVADVRTLDKKKGTTKQLTQAGTVKQDLIITAYKPSRQLETNFRLIAGTEDGVWDFVRSHLMKLPVFVVRDGASEVIAERQNYLIFDRLVAFHVQRGVSVPLSASEFYAGLEQGFSEREGMYFLPEQVAEYDKKRMTVKEVLQLQLFVSGEASAIQWVKQQIIKKPQTFQELHPQFLKETGSWQKHEQPLELSELLEQSFLRYEGKGDVPSQIHSYLSTNFRELRNRSKDSADLRIKGKDRWYVPDPNKAGDLEKMREKALLKEFREYEESKQRRLKVFRLEAVRAGFRKAWHERDYQSIIAVAQKISEDVLHEDQKLLMWYDQALTRTGEDG